MPDDRELYCVVRFSTPAPKSEMGNAHKSETFEHGSDLYVGNSTYDLVWWVMDETQAH